MSENERRRIEKPSSIRWPIYVQLLLPMVSMVLLASLLATAITALWIARRVRDDQISNLDSVAETLGEATFPLTAPVLSQLKGLSGAEFVLVDDKGELRETTLSIEGDGLDRLAGIRPSSDDGQPAVTLGERDYMVECVRVEERFRTGEGSTLWILYPEDKLASRVYQAVFPAVIAGLIAAAVAVAITSWLARRMTRPLAGLAERTAAIAQGDFTTLPVGRRNDELRDLVETINRMTEQLAEYERRIRHQERLRTLGQLGASMAHQLRNAAAGGRMAIELHRRECSTGETDESLDVALRQLKLMESYLRQFLSIGESAPAAPQRVNTTLLVEDVLSLVRPSCVHAGIDMSFAPPEQPMFLEGDPESLRQLVTNLVLNASEATGGKTPSPRVLVEIMRNSDGEGSIRVRDNGPGPEEEVGEQLFDSFVTTKPDGFGIGLFVARKIAERHGGRLDWWREGDETCFSFDFPLAAENVE